MSKFLITISLIFVAAVTSADASLYFVPGGAGTMDGLSLANARAESFSGSSPNNPDADDVESITGFSGELTEHYKDNQGGAEEGSFASSYSTTYANTAGDPEDATISYVSGSKITDAEFLLIKDGNHTPIWYIFDISDWDGMMDLIMEDFWPAQGAISHVSILGGDDGFPPGSGIPEPTSVVVWSIILLCGTIVGFRRRRT